MQRIKKKKGVCDLLSRAQAGEFSPEKDSSRDSASEKKKKGIHI